MKRVTTGLPELDKLLEGGFPDNTNILLSGGPGTGKTLFGLNFLVEGASRGERCCYLTLNESKKDLLRACNLEKLKPIHEHLDSNLVVESLEMGGEVDINYFENLFNSYPKTDRLVIDNLNKLLIHDCSLKYGEIPAREHRVHHTDLRDGGEQDRHRKRRIIRMRWRNPPVIP